MNRLKLNVKGKKEAMQRKGRKDQAIIGKTWANQPAQKAHGSAHPMLQEKARPINPIQFHNSHPFLKEE
jgi:hypothetical protein